jgi:nitrous oxidase accessory protein
VLDGGGQGTVVTLAAAGTSLRGFLIRGSGTDLNSSDAGVYVKVPDAVVEHNRIEGTLFGISLDDAARSVVRGNSVVGMSLGAAERGDGIRLWYSPDVLIENNTVTGVRDCVVWYSDRVRIVGNSIRDGRYGLHFMYNDGAVVERNTLLGNSVGAYLMYTHGVSLRGNLLAANRGPSGFGLGLKEVDDVVAEENWLVDNRVGIYNDHSPISPRASAGFRNNAIAYNDIGLALLPNVQRNSFTENAFVENLQQVSIQGGGSLRNNVWSADRGGNYWSDYSGFDAGGDGVGDAEYRAEALLGDLLDRQPRLRIVQFGLAAGALEFAARAFPGLRPPPKVSDPAPLMAMPRLEPPPGLAAPDRRPLAAVAAGLLALAGGGLCAAWSGAATGRGLMAGTGRAAADSPTSALPAVDKALTVAELRRRFGRAVAVDGLSLEVAAGEALALWGPNGAGKSTAIKCLLGLLPCRGQVVIAGQDALRSGREARRAVGYVPQEVALHDDLTVLETARLYASLKRVEPTEIEQRLEALGLADQAGKRIAALSGGMKQRLALALALLGNPRLLVLDEPTSNLDARGRDQVLQLLASARERGTAILFASHRLEEVEILADRVVVLDHGKPAFTCRPADLASRLGLRQSLKLQIAREQWDQALAVLRAACYSPTPNGRAIGVFVAPDAKGLPISLLERAGVRVVDFSLEDGVAGGRLAEPR